MHWQNVIKKLKNKIPQWTSSQLNQLDKIADTPAGKALIPDSVTLTNNIEDLSERNLILKFDHYQESECRFAEIDETKIGALIEKFKRFTSIKVKELDGSGMIRRTLNTNSGQFKEYCSLFKRLPPDVTILYETELPGGGRIFFFRVENEIQIVSIETKHRDTH